MQNIVSGLDGAYALGVIHADQPDTLVGARKGSPLVVGVGIGEAFLASDPLALLQVTDRFIYLKEGDVVRLRPEGSVEVFSEQRESISREVITFEHGDGAASKGNYRHFMLKEIHEQASVIASTLEGRLGDHHVLTHCFGSDADTLLGKVKNIQIVACGTSYHAGMVARYWIEKLAGVPTQVEVASEYRYREVVVPEGTLFVTLSQSGETADTLAALRYAASKGGYLASLSICNVPGSSLVRESDLCLMTQAGPEIGVASTKAFTSQLIAMMLLTLSLRMVRQGDDQVQADIVAALRGLPGLFEKAAAESTDDPELQSTEARVHRPQRWLQKWQTPTKPFVPVPVPEKPPSACGQEKAPR